jgi:hypothetical protein
MYAKRLLGIVAVAVVVAGCADLSQPMLPATADGPAMDAGHTFGSGNRTLSEEPTAPPAPGDGEVLSDGEVCYEERGGGAMGSGGRVVVPCPVATS